jgi:hypothetical protein
MSASHIILRLLTLFFLLAGILLLRKPVFGQSVTAPLNSTHLLAKTF